MYDGLKGISSSTLHFAMKTPIVGVVVAAIITGAVMITDKKEVVKEPPKPAIIKIVKTTKKVIIAVPKGIVLFDFDKFNIDKTAKKLLEKVAAQMKEHPNKVLILKGHTDKFGPGGYNQILSENRGNAVKDYLIKLGVPPDRIKSVEGFGKTLLLPDMTHHQNRRVIILFVDK